jgi:hypothetical protein
MDIVRAGETTPAVSRTLRKGYERVTISGDQNPGAGAYEARLCSSDGSGCPAKTTFTVGPTKLIYGTTGPYANQNNQEHWLFDYYGASNRGVCDRVQIVSQGDFANANPQPAMALQRENRAWRNYSDFWCYLTVVEGQTGGSFPMKPLAPGQYVAYVSDGLGDKIEPHAAVSFTSSQTKAMQFPKSYYELGPVGAKQGIYRGAPPIEFGWDGKAEQGRTLTSLIVRHGNILDGLELVYDNGAARADYGNRRANSGDTISLNRGERLVEVSGFYGSWFGARHILQLTLTTSAGRTFGPYGNMEFSNTRKPFKFSAPAGGGIVDFIGASVLVDYNVDPDVERVISALGVIVEAP